MSAKKHVLRLKRRKAASDGDIRYLGPLSYRAFEILGWLCVVMCVGIIVMTVLKSMSSKQGTGQGLPQGIKAENYCAPVTSGTVTQEPSPSSSSGYRRSMDFM